MMILDCNYVSFHNICDKQSNCMTFPFSLIDSIKTQIVTLNQYVSQSWLMVRSDSFTTKVASDDIRPHLMKNEITCDDNLTLWMIQFQWFFYLIWFLIGKVTLVLPCCTRKREQFECCRCPPRSASFLTFHFSHFIGFLIGDLLPLNHSSSFNIHHHLPVKDLLLKSSLWKCKIKESFYAFHRKCAIKLFWGWHTFSQCVAFPTGVSAFRLEMLRSTPEILWMHNSSQFAAFNGFFWTSSRQAAVEMFRETGDRWMQSFSPVLRNFFLVFRLQNQHAASV